MKHLTAVLFGALLLLSLGCENESESAIRATMAAVNDAVHRRDAAGIVRHLSKSSKQRITEAYESLSNLHSQIAKMPLKERQDLERQLPPSVIAKKQSSFINDLLDTRLGQAKLDAHTQTGLEIASVTQESKSEAQTVTKSEQRFAFSLEDGEWKIHLFEKGLRAVIDDAREANQAIALTLQRNEKRRQIESVIHNALKKGKR